MTIAHELFGHYAWHELSWLKDGRTFFKAHGIGISTLRGEIGPDGNVIFGSVLISEPIQEDGEGYYIEKLLFGHYSYQKAATDTGLLIGVATAGEVAVAAVQDATDAGAELPNEIYVPTR